MRVAQYRSMERTIAGHDGGGIWDRWRYGRMLLVDAEKTTVAGNLKHGVLDKLIAAAAKDGIKISEREIQWRLQAARTYPTEAQIRTVRSVFGSWYDLRLALFPDVAAPAGAVPYDPRQTSLLLAQHDDRGARLLPDADQLAFDFFPKNDVDDTVADARRYAEEMVELTARFHARDVQRFELLERMSEAVGGDETRTIREALDLLAADDDDDDGNEPS